MEAGMVVGLKSLVTYTQQHITILASTTNNQ